MNSVEALACALHEIKAIKSLIDEVHLQVHSFDGNSLRELLSVRAALERIRGEQMQARIRASKVEHPPAPRPGCIGYQHPKHGDMRTPPSCVSFDDLDPNSK